MIEEDREFRLAIAGALGLREILEEIRSLREHVVGNSDAIKNLQEQVRNLQEEVRSLQEQVRFCNDNMSRLRLLVSHGLFR